MAAVNVTLEAEQTGPAGLAEMLIVGVTDGVTIRAMVSELTDAALAQATLDVNTHQTWSPAFHRLSVKVA